MTWHIVRHQESVAAETCSFWLSTCLKTFTVSKGFYILLIMLAYVWNVLYIFFTTETWIQDGNDMWRLFKCCKESSGKNWRYGYYIYEYGFLANYMHLLLLLHTFNGLFSRTTCVSWYQKGKTTLGFEWGKRLWGFWDALASAGPYANNLHLAPDR